MLNLVLIVLFVIVLHATITILFYKVLKPDEREVVIFIPICMVTFLLIFGLMYNVVVLSENRIVDRIEQGTYTISKGLKVIEEDTTVLYKIEGYER